MVVKIQSMPKWLFSQLGILVIGVGLLSLVFNYAYRYTVDRTINSPGFYLATVVLAAVVFFIFRRDYIFVNRFEFSDEAMVVGSLLGLKKRYPTSQYAFVPALHKAVNFPEPKASLSFYVRDRKTGKNLRNYSWAGFAPEAFSKVSQLYGYSGDTDFSQKDFGRKPGS